MILTPQINTERGLLWNGARQRGLVHAIHFYVFIESELCV